MSYKFLTVPGLASSGPGHWQSIWERQYPHYFQRVKQDNWDWPVKEEWVERLQEYVSMLTEPAYLVGHSMGCITIAHWAEEFSSPLIKGALLVAPADVELSKRLTFVVGFRPIPEKKLPFPSCVVASSNDMYASIQRAGKFAEDWGSDFVNIGKKGHINAVSGLDDWQEGKLILRSLSGVELNDV